MRRNLTRPLGEDVHCWRVHYSRSTGSVFIVDSWVYEWIKTYGNQPRKLNKLLAPLFDTYVQRKKFGSLI